MKQYISTLLLIGLLPTLALAQTPFNGVVFGRINGKLQPLSNALVAAPASGNATYTDSTGNYSLQLLPQDSILLYSYAGYIADTVSIKGLSQYDVTLDQAVNLREVTVTGKRDETFISTLNQHKTEVITGEGLQKNACCNLAESFESNPSVDATVSDAVTGSKQIQMLGLSGTYVQMQTDLLPGIRGLNVLTGLNDIPGPFIEGIHIRKGPGSVTNGFEAITGQIDVELIKPMKADKFFINGYGDTESRMELNTYFRQDIGKWSSLTMLHGSRLNTPTDMNGDGFFDRSMFERINVIHRWQHVNPHGKNTEFGVKWNYNDERSGNIESRYDDLAPLAYHIDNNYNRQEAFAKTCFSLGEKSVDEVGIQIHGVHHDRTMRFGNSTLQSEEYTGYANAIFNLWSKNTKHAYRFGPSAYISRFTEVLHHSHPTFGSPDVELTNVTYDLSRDEVIPGAFAEYTYDNLKKLSIIAGIRADYTPTKSIIPTPRLHLRYKITDKLVARVSAGTGWRMPHPLTEHVNYFVSSRAVYFDENIKPEQAANYGVNLTHSFEIAKRPGEWSVDVYRTDFMQQTVVDIDRSANEIHFSNLHGQSYSNSVQAQVKHEVLKNLTLLVAAKYNDAKTTYNGVLLQKPFSPTWRGLVNASYGIWKNKIKLDGTMQFVGEQRIPDLTNAEHHLLIKSPAYTKLLGQVTYQEKKWEVYVGGENLAGFVQDQPIVTPNDPFGPNFDAAMIWGPVTGPMIYAGFRFKILNK